jgi:hypothetical protein
VLFAMTHSLLVISHTGSAEACGNQNMSAEATKNMNNHRAYPRRLQCIQMLVDIQNCQALIAHEHGIKIC